VKSPIAINKKCSVECEISAGHFFRSLLAQTTWTLRPNRRLRLIVLRPPTVRILARKPIFFARLRFDILCG
jgi:hypothetical protein